MNELRPEFWLTVPLDAMTSAEWDALCDGCGKCCLQKLYASQPARLIYTRIACPLLDGESCRCSKFETRHQYIPNCVVLSVETLKDASKWLPTTCAYKRLFEGDTLPDWHPLVTGDPESPHLSGNSARGQILPVPDLIAGMDHKAYTFEEIPLKAP